MAQGITIKDKNNIPKFVNLFLTANELALAQTALLLEGQIKAKTPVLTGNLKAGIIGHLVNQTQSEVYTEVEYAQYVEFGTIKMSARSMMRTAFDENTNNLFNNFLKIINSLISKL